jgi:hypothetical protein
MIEYNKGHKFPAQILDAIDENLRHRRLFFFVNELKYENNNAYYPFPLCFRDPDSLFRFYNGELLIYVVVDMDRVNEILAPHGLSARVSDHDHFTWQIVPSVDVERSWCISSHMVWRLAGEFLRLGWRLENTVISGLGAPLMQRLSEAKAAT